MKQDNAIFMNWRSHLFYFHTNNQSQAISLTHKGKTGFVDDIVKGLAELDKQEEKEAKKE